MNTNRKYSGLFSGLEWVTTKSPVDQFRGLSAKLIVNLYRSTMNLEQQIKQLCRSIIACESDEEAIALMRELRPLLQLRLAELCADSDGASPRNAL